MADDDIVQLIDDQGGEPPEQGPRWKIAVIDDEPAVHDGTRFALSDYKLNGQGLEIVSAYSAAEGRELMRKHPDVAVVLLDVIMETDTAGLDLVEFIRSDLKNDTVRIILRTGQPGQAPERRIIVDYDINDNWSVTFADSFGWNRSSLDGFDQFCAACATLALNGTTQSGGSTTASSVPGPSSYLQPAGRATV